MFVFSGSLRGVEIHASAPRDAVVKAVQEEADRRGFCVLGPAIRVSSKSKGVDPGDAWYGPPYEDWFPELFEGDLDVRVIPVEEP